jgi:glycosyltransferase involved in cell wall biosynthesis
VLAAVHAAGATAREVLQSGAGLVVPPEDPEALVSALWRFEREPELGPTLADAGVAYAEAQLSPAACLARAGAFVTALLAGQPIAAVEGPAPS